MSKGKFITFEGSEGCGKSTQSRLLLDYLHSKGLLVQLYREPGGVPVSEKIRALLLDKEHMTMNKECETLLYMAARAQVVEEAILPALQEGTILLCDRFLDSTLAYQGYGCGVPGDIISRLGAFAAKGLEPDVTFLLDIDVEEGLRRRGAERDRIELRSLEYHNKVRAGYLAIAKNNPERIVVIDGSLSREEIFVRIQLRVEALLH